MTNNTNNIASIITCTGRRGAKACSHAAKAGRTIHAIPAHRDDFYLVLPTYHFTSAEEALTYVSNAFDNAPLVTSDADRESFEAQEIAFKIPRTYVHPSRRNV
jgi:hypothetical protein